MMDNRCPKCDRIVGAKDVARRRPAKPASACPNCGCALRLTFVNEVGIGAVWHYEIAGAEEEAKFYA